MKELLVQLGERSYSILIGSEILKQAGKLTSRVAATGKALLVSNPTVFSLYGEQVVDSLKRAGFKIIRGLMPDGEEYKNMDEAMKILDIALEAGLERNSVVVVLGGGVAGDLGGLVAALYLRGIDFVQLPTTLLAQVDSSIGGKVAVNHPRGKNMLGAFHQPRLVIADTAVLATLNDREYRAGLGEAVKYGIIYDEKFFTWMENNYAGIRDQDTGCLEELIYQSCRIKADIVADDEKELGIRAILNLGHTFGHSIEKLTNYNTYRHGEAVAMGIRAASYLAHQRGYLSITELNRIEALLGNLGILWPFPDLNPEALYEGMLNDKKVRHGKLRIVIPGGIGGYLILNNVSREEIMATVEKFLTK